MTSATITSTFSAIDASAKLTSAAAKGPGLLHTIGMIIAGLTDGLNSAHAYEELVRKGIAKPEAARMALGVMSDGER